ncbi:unnamed protein product [Linum trigynum]|uniref:Uncharacterized protein n=1 Tax=Linum trigynum TaxID=586398 RepID=A0AAV2DEC3_9ROSI
MRVKKALGPEDAGLGSRAHSMGVNRWRRWTKGLGRPRRRSDWRRSGPGQGQGQAQTEGKLLEGWAGVLRRAHAKENLAGESHLLRGMGQGRPTCCWVV